MMMMMMPAVGSPLPAGVSVVIVAAAASDRMSARLIPTCAPTRRHIFRISLDESTARDQLQWQPAQPRTCARTLGVGIEERREARRGRSALRSHVDGKVAVCVARLRGGREGVE